MKFIWHYYYYVTLTLGAGGEAASAEAPDSKKQKLSEDTIPKPDEETGSGIAKQYYVNLAFGRCDVLCLLKLIVFLGGSMHPLIVIVGFPYLGSKEASASAKPASTPAKPSAPTPSVPKKPDIFAKAKKWEHRASVAEANNPESQHRLTDADSRRWWFLAFPKGVHFKIF